MKIPALLSGLCFLIAISDANGAPFQNLNFDEANTNNLVRVPDVPDYFNAYNGPASELLPGWQLFYGSRQETTLLYNWAPIGGGNWGALYGANGSYGLGVFPNFGVYYLRQQGDIPADARTIRFRSIAQLTIVDSKSHLEIDGVDIPLIYSGYDPSSRFTSFSGNISAFSGKNVSLEFITQLGDAYDDIEFLVPEPGTWALLGIGGLILLGRAAFVRRRPGPIRAPRDAVT